MGNRQTFFDTGIEVGCPSVHILALNTHGGRETYFDARIETICSLEWSCARYLHVVVHGTIRTALHHARLCSSSVHDLHHDGKL